jgi:hypothetical protein
MVLENHGDGVRSDVIPAHHAKEERVEFVTLQQI